MTNTGTVKWFNLTKGYGFIAPSDGQQDVFIHITALKDANISNLNEGQRIRYNTTTNKGKTFATDIELV